MIKYLLIALPFIAGAGEWPTYKNDFRRSGVTSSEISSNIKLKWVRKSPVPPQTAWSSPAKWDAYSGNAGLQSLRNFDPAFFVTGRGAELYYGSSVDNAVHCMDVSTGKEKWVFFTNGPVRFPPTLANGRLYAGSDDGFVYCLSTEGKLIWKYQAVPKARLIVNNGKLISTWPVRTGVVVRDSRAFFAASLVPWEPSYVCCVDAKSGKEIYKSQHREITLEGAMLAAADRLIIPQGRASALIFDIKSGNNSGHLGNAGSTFLLLTDDEKVISGPKSQKAGGNVVNISDAGKKVNMARLDGTDRMIIDGKLAWYHQSGEIICMNRVDYTEKTYERSQLLNEKKAITKNIKKLSGEKKVQASKKVQKIDATVSRLTAEISKTTLWKAEAPLPLSFIKAGKHLICGMENRITAVDSETGKTVWTHGVKGKVYGLASWNGNLFASTDLGYIYCFGQ